MSQILKIKPHTFIPSSKFFLSTSCNFKSLPKNSVFLPTFVSATSKSKLCSSSTSDHKTQVFLKHISEKFTLHKNHQILTNNIKVLINQHQFDITNRSSYTSNFSLNFENLSFLKKTQILKRHFNMAAPTASGDAPVATLPNVVFVLGGPGAGKGTQCANIVEKYGYVHLSAGDLLRAERKNPESKVGQLIEDYIVNGKIVPVEITCQLLETAMTNATAADASKINFLIDGFPRNQDNLDGWMKQMGEKSNLKFVLFFDCTEEVCTSRLLERGKDSGRSDDNIESIKKRFHTYHDSTMPIINHFEKLDKVKKIDSTQSKQAVFEEVQKIFN